MSSSLKRKVDPKDDVTVRSYDKKMGIVEGSHRPLLSPLARRRNREDERATNTTSKKLRPDETPINSSAVTHQPLSVATPEFGFEPVISPGPNFPQLLFKTYKREGDLPTDNARSNFGAPESNSEAIAKDFPSLSPKSTDLSAADFGSSKNSTQNVTPAKSAPLLDPCDWQMLLLALLVRLVMVIYGEWQDAHMLVKYTDVDYSVFTDAVIFLLKFCMCWCI
jgi:hypothetical protein